MAISPLGIPIFVNIITEILFTMKYGMPSAKYRVGIHHHGVFFPVVMSSKVKAPIIMFRDNNVPIFPYMYSLAKP